MVPGSHNEPRALARAARAARERRWGREFAAESRSLRLNALAIVAVALGGAAPVKADSAGSQIAKSDWPQRVTEGLNRLAAATEGQDGDALSVRVRRAAPRGLGIVLELDPAESGDESPSTNSTEFVFVSFSPPTRGVVDASQSAARAPKAITAADIQRGVRWELFEPKAKPARGLVVHLGGNKYVRRALLADGWVVLSSSGTGRYFERRRNPRTYDIKSDDDIAAVGRRIAASIDDELADWPYSLEAVLEHLADHRPDIPQQPAVVMGFSIGAIGLPAVVARMPDRFAAAVIVAGGADLLKISQTSRKANPGIELNWIPPALARGGFAALDAVYLAHAKLDPYNAAAALGDTPILMFHASFDQVVPAKSGDELWRRLGKPERRVFPVGHGHLLRVVMRMQAGNVAEWTAAKSK